MTWYAHAVAELALTVIFIGGLIVVMAAWAWFVDRIKKSRQRPRRFTYRDH